MSLGLKCVFFGRDGVANPETLFAAGYSACFEGAMGLAVKQHGIDAVPAGTSVTGNEYYGGYYF